MNKITAIINTYNEERYIERAIKSLDFVDEILVCDMQSDDDTAVIAKKLGAKVFFLKRIDFVEPARNFAISKANTEWVLILDPDEEIPSSLADYLKEMIKKPIVSDYVEIPRKNIIFKKWMKAANWWPDYNIRFFKKTSVKWGRRIHRPPKVSGQGIKLPDDERWAIVHHHYESVSQFLNRMDRYSSVQARELKEEGYNFDWKDLFRKPLGEFLSRYFAGRGFEDGIHGLALSFLQAFSFLVVYLKAWEMKGFPKSELKIDDIRNEIKSGKKETDYWLRYGNLSKNPFKRFLQRAKNKLS